MKIDGCTDSLIVGMSNVRVMEYFEAQNILLLSGGFDTNESSVVTHYIYKHRVGVLRERFTFCVHIMVMQCVGLHILLMEHPFV